MIVVRRSLRWSCRSFIAVRYAQKRTQLNSSAIRHHQHMYASCLQKNCTLNAIIFYNFKFQLIFCLTAKFHANPMSSGVSGVQLSSDLSLDKHVNVVSSKCFFQLRQLRRIRRSLDDDSVATLVHAFVASRVDYCGSLLIGAPRKTTYKLQRVLNSAARIVSNTRKFDRGLTHFRRSQLHWPDVVDRVRFRVCVQVFRCLHKMAPEYLSTYCQPVSGISGRRHLRSADRK